RFVAWDVNATRVPSADSDANQLVLLAITPASSLDANVTSAGPAGAVGPLERLWGRGSCPRPWASTAEPVTESQVKAMAAAAGWIATTGAARVAASPAMKSRR